MGDESGADQGFLTARALFQAGVISTQPRGGDRAVHCAAVRRPLIPRAFGAALKERVTAGLDWRSASRADGVQVITRKGGLVDHAEAGGHRGAP